MYPQMDNHTATYGELEPSGGSTVKTLFQVPGAPCNELQGYCDVFYKCRNVDSNGPLSRLKDAILNPQLYKDIAGWLKVSWTSRANKFSFFYLFIFNDFPLTSKLQKIHFWQSKLIII